MYIVITYANIVGIKKNSITLETVFLVKRIEIEAVLNLKISYKPNLTLQL